MNDRDQELRRQAEAVARRRTEERDQLRAAMPNGYGCRHPDQQDRDPWSGEGRCFTFSCPFGTKLMPDSDPEDREWIEELGYNPDGLTDEGNWMVLDKKPRRIVRLPILGNDR